MSIPNDFAADLLRNAKNLPTDVLAKLILAYQKSLAIPEDEIVDDPFIYSPLIDLHDTSVDISDGDIIEDEFDNHIGSIGFRKLIPPTVHSDPLVYDFTNISGLTFNQPDTENSVGTRFNGAGITDGNSFIKIDDDSILAITDEIIIATYAYLKIGSASIGSLTHKGDLTSFSLIRNAADAIVFAGTVGASTFSLSHTITADGWYHIVATAKSGIQTLYIDKVSQDSGVLGGVIGTDANDVGIYAESDGSNKLQDEEGLAWLSIINGFADQIWVDNDFNGIRDVSDMDEIICFPFMGAANPQPPMTSGLFVSGA